MKKNLFAVLVMLFVASLFAEKLQLMTEEYPPYNFSEGKEIKGVVTEIVQEIMKRTGIESELKVYPWPRAYSTTLKKPNTALFATTFSEEREPLFKWVGPVIPTKISLMAKKSKKIKLKNTEDANNYRIGVIRDDIGEQLLINSNVKELSLKRAPTPLSNVKKLAADRVDLVAYEENTAKWIMKKEGLNLADYETVHVLKEGQLYIAFNRATDDKTIVTCQKALDEIKEDGTFAKISKKYFK